MSLSNDVQCTDPGGSAESATWISDEEPEGRRGSYQMLLVYVPWTLAADLLATSGTSVG